MKSRLCFLLLLLLIGFGALAFRLPGLGSRPMHADESVHAARFRGLWEDGHYIYNPNEFHGPTLPYATLPAAWLAKSENFAETTEAMYRLVPVLFGAGLVLLLWLLGDALGKPAAVCAGVLTAISPTMVFYSRYYIHETLLIFFTLAAVGTGWRYFRTGKLGWCLAAGGCLGLMQATKETSVLAYFSMAVAFGLSWFWMRRFGENARRQPPAMPYWHFALAAAVAIAAATVLLSSFFTNPGGPLHGVLTYAVWVRRAGGESLHTHPWYYYLEILTYWQVGGGPRWSEGLILALAAVGLVTALIPSRAFPREASPPFVRWTGFYTILLIITYGAIPYKTPWCALGMLQGMILLAGVGAVALTRMVSAWPWKGIVAIVLSAAAGQLAWQAYRASYVLDADPRNPYVYAHTLPDLKRLAHDVEELAKSSPDGHEMPIQVIWYDCYYWPLPWYLRRFDRVDWWRHVPEGPGSPVVISSAQLDAPLSTKLDATHMMTGYYGVRPNVLAQLWVRIDLWEAHLKRLGRL